MKTISLLTISAALLLAACSKNDNRDDDKGAPPIGPKTPLYIASYVALSSLGDSIRYDYNSDRTLQRQAMFIAKDTGRAFVYYPQYENGQLMRINEARSTKDMQGKPWISFSRNSGGQITTLSVANSTSHRQFTYNEAGQLAEMRIYGTGMNDSSILRYTWEGKNVAKVTETGSSFGSPLNNTITYTYNDRWNPYSYMGLPIFLSGTTYSHLSDNNVETETWVVNGKTYITTYEYVYNDKHYPTHIKSTTTGYSSPILEEMDITYWPE
jgi:hypothetical protein